MVGALVFAGIAFYAVLYSGMSSFAGTPISTLAALRGKISATPKAATGITTPAQPRYGHRGMTQTRLRP